MKAIGLLLVTIFFLCIAQFPSFAQANKPVSLEQKYSVDSFEKLRWKIEPPELANAQTLENGEWTLFNRSSGQMLLLADYEETNIAVNCDIIFPKVLHSYDSISFFFNYNYHDELGLAYYAQLRITPDGKYYFGHTDGSHMVIQQEGRFPLAHDNPRKVTLHAAKLRTDLFLAINGRRTTIRTGIEEKQGGFGFMLPQGASAHLRKFRFVVYGEVNYPFEGVDVIKLFAPKESSG